MPFYNDLTEATRKLITKESIVEIIFLRAACCAGGNGGNYGCCCILNGPLFFLVTETCWFLIFLVASVNGARYSSESLQKSGVSSSCISILSDFIKWVRKLGLLEEEFAIIVVLILMSPDRGIVKDVDRCQLYRVQEIFRDILRQFIVDKFPETATKRLGKRIQFIYSCFYDKTWWSWSCIKIFFVESKIKQKSLIFWWNCDLYLAIWTNNFIPRRRDDPAPSFPASFSPSLYEKAKKKTKNTFVKKLSFVQKFSFLLPVQLPSLFLLWRCSIEFYAQTIWTFKLMTEI